ncbi:hypothetical protein TrLO_g14681 [Triparma laevis f. longispina]|uniref:PH domain-containing protein n=1 Tax=Triparma laevis f. longispina TaxID=1714387 RepID=A0A9W7A178_9STRA|nr:hypothetical protein TrLO_g14681 [Triparma laevis f. longispina]
MQSESAEQRHTLSNTLAHAIAGNSRAIVKGKNIARRSVFAKDSTRLSDIKGYLLKKSSKGVYQRRFFYLNNAYLIYKQKESSKKLDAVIDLRNCVAAQLLDRHGEMKLELLGVDDDVEVNANPNQSNGMSFHYFLKAKDNKDATKWVNNIKLRMQYYDKLDSAGQSEIAEIFHEEERRDTTHFHQQQEPTHGILARRLTTDYAMIEDAEDGEVNFEGWLWKKSPSKWVKYQERYCLLSRGVLSYYKSSEPGKPAQGAVSMSSCQYIRLFEDSPACVEFEVKVSSGRTFLFKAETPHNCAAWVQALKDAKQTDAIVQEELETVRVRAISPPSIINFDKLGKNEEQRRQQTTNELEQLFPEDSLPEQTIAACTEAVVFLKNIEKDCRADLSIGKPCRPDVLKHYLQLYMAKMEAEVLPLLEEKSHSATLSDESYNAIEDVDVDNAFKRAEALSRKYLKTKQRATRNRSVGKKTIASTAAIVEKKLSGFDKWLFGDDIKQQELRASENPDESTEIDPQPQFEEDEDPPVLFTLNMSDLRNLISLMYSYQDLLTTIGIEYKDETFGVSVTNRLWPYLAVVIDAYVEGEDGARRQMQDSAQTCLQQQMQLGSAAVVDIETSNLKFTHTPADLWETLNAHTHIAGLGERNNERLQLKTLTAIAGIVNATVKNIVEDTVKNGKKHGWEYVCAVINDCSQHVESLDSIISLISSEPVRKRLDPIFENLTFQIYESAERCCGVLVSIVYDDLKQHVSSLFDDRISMSSDNHNLTGIVATITDYCEDFKSSLQEFYFVKLNGIFMQTSISIYLSRFVDVVTSNAVKAKTNRFLSTGGLEDDINSWRECFTSYLSGRSIDVPLTVMDCCIKFQCCSEEEISTFGGELVRERGATFGSSVFQCIKCVTMLRKDAIGEPKSEARVAMLRELAEIISEMAKPNKNGDANPELGRDGEIFANAFPVDNKFVKTLTSLKQSFGLRLGKGKSNERDDLFRELEHAAEEDFEDTKALKDHIDVDQAKTNNAAALTHQGSKRRVSGLLEVGLDATRQSELSGIGTLSNTDEVTDLEGWLEKQSPSHNLWQARYFYLKIDSKDKKNGGKFSWHKQPSEKAQKSMFLKDISAEPVIVNCPRPLVYNKQLHKTRLRLAEDKDSEDWLPVDCKSDGQDSYEFNVETKTNKKRVIILRSNGEVDEMLKWVNGLTTLYWRFNTFGKDDEGGENGELSPHHDDETFKKEGGDEAPDWNPAEKHQAVKVKKVKRPSIRVDDEIGEILGIDLGEESEDGEGEDKVDSSAVKVEQVLPDLNGSYDDDEEEDAKPKRGRKATLLNKGSELSDGGALKEPPGACPDCVIS